MPPSAKATIPNTSSSTPMSFTSTSGAGPLHAAGQRRWFVVADPKPAARARLIAFPHAGGGPSVYAAWARAFENEPIEVAAAHLPGRDERAAEPAPADLDVLV